MRARACRTFGQPLRASWARSQLAPDVVADHDAVCAGSSALRASAASRMPLTRSPVRSSAGAPTRGHSRSRTYRSAAHRGGLLLQVIGQAGAAAPGSPAAAIRPGAACRRHQRGCANEIGHEPRSPRHGHETRYARRGRGGGGDQVVSTVAVSAWKSGGASAAIDLRRYGDRAVRTAGSHISPLLQRAHPLSATSTRSTE